MLVLGAGFEPTLPDYLSVAEYKTAVLPITLPKHKEKFEEKPTRKLAIELFCISCMGGEDNIGYRQLIKDCTSWGCPLRRYRPYK